MTKYNYANWVTGIYLQLVKEEESCHKNFHESNIYRFFSRDDSKHKIKTLHAITQASSNTVMTSPLLELNAMDIICLLLNEIEDHDSRYESIRKKEFTRALTQFRKATNQLFDTLNFTHSSSAFDLIENAPAMWVGKPTSSMSEHEAELSNALKAFWEKSAHQVLMEYSDRVESLGTGDKYFLVNNREPTTSQIRVRLAVYLIIALCDLETIKQIDNIGAFITHLLVISSSEFEDIDRNDVNKLIKTAIEICETHGQPILME